VAWRMLGAGAGVLGGEGVAGYLHPALGEALAAIDVLVPLAVAVVLLTAVLCGSDQTCERGLPAAALDRQPARAPRAGTGPAHRQPGTPPVNVPR